MTKTKSLVILLAAGFALLTWSSAWADTCGTNVSVDTLNSASFSCTVADKTFTFGTNSITGTGVPQITGVTFFTDDPLTAPFDPGFFINFSGFSVSDLGGPTSLDVVVRYTVEAPGDVITDDHLGFAGNVSGTGVASVDETVCQFGTDICNPYSLSVLNLDGNDFDKLADFNTFAPVSKLSVLKDIEIVLGPDVPGQFDRADTSIVSQSFSEVVPEPGTLMLLGSGFVFAGGAMRRSLRWSRPTV
jgi:PEP-CTERM motif-containing protein